MANYLNAFRAPDLAGIDRAAYSNRLMRNDVERIPQRNAAEDMAIQADQVTLAQNRTENARRMAADMFAAIADAPDPISTGALLVQSQAFREIGGELKLPVDQFRPGPGDNPEQIRSAARSWAQAVGAQPQAAEGFTLSPGQTRYGPSGQPLATAPQAPLGGADSPSNVREYEYYQNLPTEEARAEYLRVKRGDTKPSSVLEKRLFDSSDAAFAARSSVQRYERVAEQMATTLPAGGAAAKWTESLKALTGSEDAVSLLRREWSSLRASEVMKNLPPGAASDADVALAMSGFLPEFANAETVASFLRGLAKMEEIKAQYHEFESEYLSETGSVVGLGQAWRARSTQAPQGAPQGGTTAPEGTMIESQDGRRMVKRNGQWVPL